MHVEEESISVLNVSRMEIRENMQILYNLLLLIGSVEDKFIDILDQLEQEIMEVKTVLILFSRLYTLLGELKLDHFLHQRFRCI